MAPNTGGSSKFVLSITCTPARLHAFFFSSSIHFFFQKRLNAFRDEFRPLQHVFFIFFAKHDLI
jgi:hypothetical protein